ncbi:HAD hydrolase family protein [Lachnotalea glycerini]|uniref:HAD family hydrolase n=1 Tax=Lachnotalea glycerini TaxID=1763509 RepID=A0A371JGJ9_9FIRM|nr:HAD hydrolase family protein [Lachnotalea glycerini]RDY31859.1 HAD family hydrolase [Lachnotalea glycerini]
MNIFNSDIDNTLIYSYKHEIGSNKKCVELYQGREISFMTQYSYERLHKICEKELFVPTTTRTIEQYKRIDFGIDEPDYALVCNGGILLKKGLIDDAWYHKSLDMISNAQSELKKAIEILKMDSNINFEIRNINQLFLFTKSKSPKETLAGLNEKLNLNKVETFTNGLKVYVMPKNLNKGNAVLRLKEKLKAKRIIAAGDSEFDISMLRVADIAFAPELLKKQMKAKTNTNIVPEGILFSDAVLKHILEL